jgi:hypothetical protein
MVKMSVDDSKTFREKVEEYWRNNQKLSRSELRRFIKLKENITEKDKAKLRQLDRYTKKLFNENEKLRRKVEFQNWVMSYLNRLTPLIKTEEDRQELENFIEKKENKKRAKEEEEEQKERLKILREK